MLNSSNSSELAAEYYVEKRKRRAGKMTLTVKDYNKYGKEMAELCFCVMLPLL